MIGVDSLVRKLTRIKELGEPTIKNELRNDAKWVYEESQRLVPVRTGWLKRTGRIREWKRGFNVIYSAPHARLVHDGEFRHPRGGQKHYLQDPMQRLVPDNFQRYQMALNVVIEGVSRES